jgi:LPXTG-motif cell wall-anchored protein
VYPNTFTGQVVVTVASSDGGHAQGAANVTVAPAPLTGIVPAAPGSIVATATDGGTAHVQWEPPSADVELSGYIVTPSVALTSGSTGVTAVEGNEAMVTDLPAGARVTFTVEAVTDAGRGQPGTSNTVVVPGDAAPTTTQPDACTPPDGAGCGPSTTPAGGTASTVSSVSASADPPSSGGGTSLPLTGSDVLSLAAAGAVLVALGAGLVLARRRRHAPSDR